MEKDQASEDPNDPRTIEGAIHAQIDERGWDTGDRFIVASIVGEVGEHNSPWHITYTVTLERIGG